MKVRWLLQAAHDVPLGDEWLSAGERARLQAMRFPRRRADFRLGRWTAKQALAAHLGGVDRLADLDVRAAESGAPEAFFEGRRLPVVLSLSHRGDGALCAVADAGPVLGCDLELREPRDPALLADYFTQEEQVAVAAAPEAERSALCALLWSAKEAALKALGTGLRSDTREVAVEVSPSGRWERGGWAPLRVRHGPSGVDFAGFWQARARQILVIVADPPPRLPSLSSLSISARKPSPAG